MLPTNFVITNTQIIIYQMRIVLENNIIKDIIKTLSQFGEVNYRMTINGVKFYRSGKLFGKLYNEQLYLLYKKLSPMVLVVTLLHKVKYLLN